MKKLVSICIPTFNGEKFIEEALESAINQTYANLEIVVSDDASKDETIKLIEKFKEKTNIPIHIHHHEPIGIGANWNNCIKYAKGEYIKFLFQDDVLYPSCIEEMVLVMNSGIYVGLVSAKRDILIEGPEPFEIKSWMDLHKDLQLKLRPNSDNLFFLDNSFFKNSNFLQHPYNKVGEPSGILFRKYLLQEIGFFREDMIQILDVEFYNRVLKKYKIAIINRKLYAFRIHALQATSLNNGKDQEDLTLYNKILFSDFFWYLNISAKQRLLDNFKPFIGKIFRKLHNFFN